MAIIEITADLDHAGPTPVEIPLPAGMAMPGGSLRLVEVDGSLTVPAQADGDVLVALLPGVRAGMRSRFRLEGVSVAAPGVKLREEGPTRLAIVLPEGVFTVYNFEFGPKEPKPFFYPVLGPGGKGVTRSYPMKEVEGEDKDHPHHRSFWTAYGDVNGVDDWSEMPKHGFQKPVKILDKKEGATFGGFTATNLWTAEDEKPLLDERRTIRVYNAGPDRRLLDYEVEFIANYGDVHYGDTKEGGILAFRVASSMDGKRGGRIENSNGAVGEKEAWGKKAAWLDYGGQVDGQVLAIGMMDHPGNLHHPCYWHARDYGLVGTNPFAEASFDKTKPNTGYTQKKGEKLLFKYRVLIHKGTAKDGKMEEAYHAWIQGPKGKVTG